MSAAQEPLSDGKAVLYGSLTGLALGVGLGAIIVLLSGNYSLATAVIVVVHSAIAMMLMGGWSAPALLSRNE